MQDLRDPDGETLKSWKEIAAFFRRDVRTVQRWEREEALPVHRDGGRRGQVWARRAELLAWWSHATVDPAREHPSQADGRRAARLSTRVAGLAAAVLLLAAAAFTSSRVFDERRQVAANVHAAGPLVVDVRPFQQPNVVVPGGVLAVALTAPANLLTELDLSTMRAGASAPHETRWQDFDSDGRPELWLYFDVSTLALRHDTTRLTIAGRTRDGRLVSGADDVIVLPAEGRSVATTGLR